MNIRLFALATIFTCGLLLKFGAPLLPVVLGVAVAATYHVKGSKARKTTP